MKNIYFLLFLILCRVSAKAQHDGSVRGLLSDTAGKLPVANATIAVLNAKDSSLVSFTRSEQTGRFLIKGLAEGSYRLLITHVGYRNNSRNFLISAPVKDIDFGPIILNSKAALLKEVTVTQEAAPVTIKQDTVEFNAGSFKTKPNAVVEDLLKKLPGVQVDKNGTIKANGEEVKKVLVDGKEFFGNDPKIASKNLPADAVDKVQVFDKKSDQAQFTGFDDGNSQKTINLTIKQNRKNGLFGKATAGAGNDSRYEGKANINRFSGQQQLSVIGMANNTNKQGFSFQDVMNFSGSTPGMGGKEPAGPFSSGVPIEGLTGNSQAVTTTLAGGLNFNDTWNTKTDFSGSYFYNRADDKIEQQRRAQYLLPGNAYTQDQTYTARRHNENHRLNLSSDMKIDSFNSLKLSSTFIYQNSNNAPETHYSSHAASDSSLLNDGFSRSFSEAKGYSWNSNALLRHRFAKKGRTLSANLSFGLNNSNGNGNLYSINNYYQPVSTDTIDQVNDQHSKGYNYGINLAYTEPLSKTTLLQFDYNFNQTHTRSGKHTFDADGSGKYNLPNGQLTNDFENSYAYHRQGIRLRKQQKKYNFSAGAAIEESALKSDFSYLAKDSSLHQSYVNILPGADFQFNFSKYRNLRMHYRTFTNQPTVTQLQPVPDNSDPLNIKAGNPDLQQEYYHSLMLNYVAFDPFRHSSFFAMLSYRGIHNKIVNDDEINSAGIRVSKPVNLNGLYNAGGNLSWGLPIRKIKSSLNLNSNISFDHNANLVNGIRNNSNNWTASQGAELNYYYKELLDITAGARLNYNDIRYSLQPGQNMNYWTQNYTLDFNLYGPKGFSIATDLDYTRRTGLSSGYNTSPFIWNAGLAKQLFKNKKGEVRLQVFDILKQNIGFTRNTNQNYTEDIRYKVLNRFWLLSFTYNINRFAGKPVDGPIHGRSNIKITAN